MKNKRWELRPLDNKIEYKTEGFLSLLAQKVLAARGIFTDEETADALNTDYTLLYDPFLLPDMEKAVAVLEQAIADGEKIAIYGDYDVDGVTSTCIMIQYLRSRGANYEYYIPDRISEGYGLNTQAIKSLNESGVNLLLTVDSGITAIDEVAYAKELGMKVIVTDHHECKEVIPQADAVVNPRRIDGVYPFKELAGVGVAFKLLCAMEHGKKTIEEMMALYGDIVAIGTIADVMPLKNENRAIVSGGLKALEHTKNKGIFALMKKLNMTDKVVSATNVSFMMAPRINAAGRLGGAAKAAEMLLTDDDSQAMELAELLCELNAQRQMEENEIYKEINRKIDIEFNPNIDKSIVMWGEGWHNGVIGIVASRLAERYFVPTVLISLDGHCGKGSGRSIKGFNLHGALEKNKAFLQKFGGHEMAVGLTIGTENLEGFKTALNVYCTEVINRDNIQPSILIDCEITEDMLTLSQVEGLSMLEPFGMGNPQPVFIIKSMLIDEITPIGKDRHIKLSVTSGNASFTALAFGLSSVNCPFVQGDMVDIVCTADVNDFRGKRNVQLIIKDIRLTTEELAKDESHKQMYQNLLNKTITKEQAALIYPTRGELVSVFRYLKFKLTEATADPASIYRKIAYESHCHMNVAKLMVCLDVMAEFNIISYELIADQIKLTVNDIERKVDINKSVVLNYLKDKQ